VRDGWDSCRFAKNFLEFGFPDVALQNKSSTLSFIKWCIKSADRFKKSFSGKLIAAYNMIKRDDSHISALVLQSLQIIVLKSYAV